QVVRAINPERSLAHAPIFQVKLVHQPVSGDELRLPGLDLRIEASGNATAKLDLTLLVTERADGFEWVCEYATDLFDRSTIARMLSHLHHLLADAVQRPDASISELALLAPQGEGAPATQADDERSQLATWSAGGAAADWQGTAYEQIARQIARTPERIALIHGAEQLSYAELGRRVRRLARYLRRLGVGPTSKVAVLDERGPDLVVTLVAVLAAGAAYVPLDPEHPAERLAFSLRDSGAQLLVTRARWADLAAPSVRAVCLDREGPAFEHERDDALDELAGADHTAYVIYTSGSTGMPKGVAIPHRGLSNFLHAMQRAVRLDDGDTLLAVTTVSFDIAVVELVLPLVCGARIVLADSRQAADPDALARMLDEHGVTVMQATPATWRMLVDAGWPGKPAMRILCGGEALPASLAAALCRRGSAVWNLYGPTEAVVWASTQPVDEAELDDAGVVALGRPLPGVTLRVVDGGLREAPIGVPGELCIGGVQVAQGYLN